MIKPSLSQFSRSLRVAGVCAAAVLSLQGCVGLVVGGAVAGALSTADRRTFGAQTEDKSIVVKGELKLSKVLNDNAHVNVNYFNRHVLLTGEVPDQQTKDKAENELKAVEGVESVINEIQIAGVSNLTARSNDALITTKVKTSFLDTKDLYANSYKVVTEAGVVYLMGRVTQREGNRAADVASSVNGVRKVVKVFEYMTEEELKALLVQPVSAEKSEKAQ